VERTPWSNLAGIRLPRTDLPGPDGCYNGCGEDRPHMLTTFRLATLTGKPTPYTWRLCDECLAWPAANRRDPRDTDPLAAT